MTITGSVGGDLLCFNLLCVTLGYLKITLNRLILMSQAKVSTVGGKYFPVTLGLLLFLGGDVSLQVLLPSVQVCDCLNSVWGGWDRVLAPAGADTMLAAPAGADTMLAAPHGPVRAVTSTLRSLLELLGPGRAPLLTLPSSLLQNIFLYHFLWSRSVRTSFFTAFCGQGLSLPFLATFLESLGWRMVELSPGGFLASIFAALPSSFQDS